MGVGREHTSKDQGCLSPLRLLRNGVEVGRGKRRGLWVGRPEITDPKGRAYGFPSLRNQGQPDTLPQSPHGHGCEPDREHSSIIEAQIGKFQRLHTLGPTSLHPYPPELACSSPSQAGGGSQVLRDSSRPSEVSGGPKFSLTRFWGNWAGMERRGMGMESEAAPGGGAERSRLRDRTWE